MRELEEISERVREERDRERQEEMEREWVEKTRLLFKIARADLKWMKRKLKRMRCRRSGPWWSAPSGIWRILLEPKYAAGGGNGMRHGIGWSEEEIGGDLIEQYLIPIIAMVRKQKSAPAIWHRARAHSLHKK